jgi:hypothetical protein
MDPRVAMATIALKHAPCSARQSVEVYTDLIVRPSDRNPKALSYFLGHGGSPPSTCALTALGVLRLAGVDDKLLTDPYKPGNAMQDLQNVASHKGALVRNPKPPDGVLHNADCWIIDSDSGDAHAGICVSEASMQPDGSYLIDTVEGGQGPDSSAVEYFVGRHLVPKGGRWYMGARYVICQVVADKLGLIDVPDANVNPEPVA